MKNTFAILTLSSLLVACASVQEPAAPSASVAAASTAPSASTDNSADAASAIADDDEEESASPSDPLPSVELTPELLFKLLSAEIAFQRGDWQSPYIAYLSSAQQTRDPRLARRAADIALQSHQAGEALSAVRLWHELAPHSEEAAQYLASLDILSDNLEKAKPILAEHLKLADPEARGLAMFQIQRMLLRAKDKAAAFATLEDLLAPYQSTVDAHLALAQASFANGDAPRAQKEIQAALAIQPDSELAILTSAQIASDKDEALAILDSFLTKHPQANEVRASYARLLIEQKQYEKARAEYEKLIGAQPDDPSNVFALGMLNAQMHDYDSAEKYLQRYLDMIATQPNSRRDPAPALLALAQIAEERKDIDAELKWLDRIEPGDAYLAAQFKRAQIMAKRGDLAAARAALKALKPESEREKIQVMLADAHLLRDSGHAADAMKTLQAGLKQFPDNADLLYDYAMTAEKLDRFALMESTLRHMMKIAPDNQHAYNALGYTLAERNMRLPEARSLIEKALQLAPDDPFIMDSMGWVYYRLGNLKQAERYLRSAYELQADPEIAAHLGEVLWKLGKKDEAQKIWREAISKDPENDTLKSTLTRLHVSP